jgi:hypothetical protein
MSSFSSPSPSPVNAVSVASGCAAASVVVESSAATVVDIVAAAGGFEKLKADAAAPPVPVSDVDEGTDGAALVPNEKPIAGGEAFVDFPALPNPKDVLLGGVEGFAKLKPLDCDDVPSDAAALPKLKLEKAEDFFVASAAVVDGTSLSSDVLAVPKLKLENGDGFAAVESASFAVSSDGFVTWNGLGVFVASVAAGLAKLNSGFSESFFGASVAVAVDLPPKELNPKDVDVAAAKAGFSASLVAAGAEAVIPKFTDANGFGLGASLAVVEDGKENDDLTSLEDVSPLGTKPTLLLAVVDRDAGCSADGVTVAPPNLKPLGGAGGPADTDAPDNSDGDVDVVGIGVTSGTSEREDVFPEAVPKAKGEAVGFNALAFERAGGLGVRERSRRVP